MRRNFAIITVVMIVLLSGCGDEDTTYRPAYFDEPVSSKSETPAVKPVSTAVNTAVSTVRHESAASEPETPEITFHSSVTDGEIAFTIEGVYSAGEFSTVTITGKDGDYRVKSSRNGIPTGLLTLDIPNGDRFLLPENILEGLTFGCEVFSDFRKFGAAEYPDIITLDFYRDTELEVPQYARFFTIADGEIEELPIYEYGNPADPRGTYLKQKSPGLMVQHLTVGTGIPDKYEIVKYEYTHDIENHRLNRRRVRFYGWEYE